MIHPYRHATVVTGRTVYLVRAAALAVALAATGCAHATATSASSAIDAPSEPATADANALAILAEADRLVGSELWPGFEPEHVPVAIFDGERAWLFRHPAPPPDFRPVAGHNRVRAYPGRHPLLTANTSVELGGVRVATLMPGDPGTPVARRAGILIHEAFHVFQRENHPAWSANEAALFTYPVDDPELLALRRFETGALRRALHAEDPDDSACWAARAIGFRQALSRTNAVPN